MRITRVMASVLIGVLLIPGACAKATLPAPTTPAPTTPTSAPTTPTPVPTTPAPAPPTPTPVPTAPAPTTPTTPAPTPATPPAVQGANEVWIVGNELRPFSITVPVGTKVTWISQDRGDIHTITSTTGLFDASLQYGQSFSYTFTERGTFSYSRSSSGGEAPSGGKVIVE